jgi:hypothetical protein
LRVPGFAGSNARIVAHLGRVNFAASHDLEHSLVLG